MPPVESTADDLRVLLLPPTRRDADALRGVLTAAGVGCAICASLPALAEEAARGVGVVLVSEEALHDGADGLAAHVRGQPVWSDLPVVVLSRAGAESPALARVLGTLGNVSVLERPVRMTTLLSVIRSCLRARQRQYEVRDHLAERERVGRALREGEERFRLLVENVKDYAIFMTDAAGRVTSWNAGAEQILGYAAGEILGRDAAVFFTPEDRAAGVPERERRTARETGRAPDVRWHVRKGGERFFVDGVMTAVRTEDGALLGYAKLMRDVTERHRAEAERERLLESERAARAEAERAGRVKDEFLATLSHELRTPLNAILGWAQIIRNEPSAADLEEGVAVIERNARAQTQIIEDLLDMSRIVNGRVRLDVRRVDLGEVVTAAVEALRPAAAAKGIRLQAVLDSAAAGPIDGDPDRLQQVFWNLLSNAVKFTPRGGRVQVVLRRAASHVEVAVVDTGEGIAPEFLPHVFDRFRQADGGTTRRHGGLGLGLAIVKQLIELHGGTVRVASAGLGAGAAFTVALPVNAVRPDEPAGAGGAAPAEADGRAATDGEPATAAGLGPRVDGVRVLVVDDEADARGLVKRVLEDRGASVTTAASAEEALAALRAARPDVLVSDVGMPDEDGYALVRRVRALGADEGGRTPAVALTAYAQTQDRVKAIAAGFEQHLVKPVNAAELVAVVAALAGRGGEG